MCTGEKLIYTLFTGRKTQKHRFCMRKLYSKIFEIDKDDEYFTKLRVKTQYTNYIVNLGLTLGTTVVMYRRNCFLQ